VIGDPHHLPRWWPRVMRVEDVGEDAFTEVMSTSKGRLVRADFDVVERDEGEHVVRWAQRVQGTPFERVLSAAETEVRLSALPTQAAATEVAIVLSQEMHGIFGPRSPGRYGRAIFPGFGSMMVRRAAAATLEEALNGLERISG
jgi:hypothetical protein